MASKGRRSKKTFKDFYDDVEDVEADGDTSNKGKKSEGASTSGKCKTVEGDSTSGNSKTFEGTGVSAKSKISKATGNPSENRTSEGTDTSYKNKTSEGTGSSAKSKTKKGTSSSGNRNTSQSTGTSGKSKTSEETGFSGKSKTSEETGFSDKSKTKGKSSTGGKKYTPPTGGTRISEFSTPYMRTTFDSVPGSDAWGHPDPNSHTFYHNTEWLGGPGPRVYRRAKSVAERLPTQFCTDGAKVKRTEADVMSKPFHVCNFCRKTSVESLKKCSRCLAVAYCSKQCQRQDFKTHKSFCRRCDRHDIARARVYPAVRFFQDMSHARDYSVLLNDMPTEEQYQDGAWCNILVEMLGQIPHFKRYICLVRDLSGLVTKVVFHDETNVYVHPSVDHGYHCMPRDLDACLVPGNFLLLVGVHWRHFQDGTVGIRVNDLNSIYVIDLADHVMAQEYKMEMEQAVANYDNEPKRPTLNDLFWKLFNL